jgi:DNA-binding transcriptional MerR regulator
MGYIDVNVNQRALRVLPGQPHPLPAMTAAPARPAPKTYTITELAQEFDVTPRAIRFYEDMGLLEPGRAGRNRVYSQRDRTRLKLTLRGKRLGFALQDIRQLVTMYDTDSDTAPQLEAFLGALAAHRAQLEQQLDDIRITLDELTLHEARCRQLLAVANKPRKRP